MPNKFLYSKTLLYLLATLLVLTFFLPELIGPVPALLIGGAIIGFAVYIYNLWSRAPDKTDPDGKDPME